MRFYSISGNSHTLTGLRLAGIEGVEVHERAEVLQALDFATSESDIGVILITEKLAALCSEEVSGIMLNRALPLIVVIPDRHGTSRAPDSITQYVRQAVGIRI